MTSKYGASDRKALMLHVGKCRPEKPLPTTTPNMRLFHNQNNDYNNNANVNVGDLSSLVARIVKTQDLVYAKEGTTLKF